MLYYYTFYDRKTDEFLFAGTARELVAKKHFTSTNDLHSIVSKVRSGANRKYAIVVDREGDEDGSA